MSDISTDLYFQLHRGKLGDEFAWLIERGQPVADPTVWWTGTRWTIDADAALRFREKAAAEAYIEERSPIPGHRDRFGRATLHRVLAPNQPVAEERTP